MVLLGIPVKHFACWYLIKLACFGYVTRLDTLSKTTLQGALEGGRRRDPQRKCRLDTIKEWPSLPMPELFTRASYRRDWKKDLCWIVPHVPLTIQSVKGLNWTELNWSNQKSSSVKFKRCIRKMKYSQLCSLKFNWWAEKNSWCSALEYLHWRTLLIVNQRNF